MIRLRDRSWDLWSREIGSLLSLCRLSAREINNPKSLFLAPLQFLALDPLRENPLESGGEGRPSTRWHKSKVLEHKAQRTNVETGTGAASRWNTVLYQCIYLHIYLQLDVWQVNTIQYKFNFMGYGCMLKQF